jgi:hypothetical protein
MTWAGFVCPLQLFIKFSSESFVGACKLMKEQLKNMPFILITQRRSFIGVKFLTMWLNFESTRKFVLNS